MIEEYGIYVLACAGGLLAGLINVVAGSGSIITLSLLALGFNLPGPVANATNRIGILSQLIIGSAIFQKNDLYSGLPIGRIIIPVLSGSLLGIYWAATITNEEFMLVYKALIAVLFILLLFKPDRWLTQEHHFKLPTWALYIIYFSLGIYGGFIQVGMGLFLLAFLVLVENQHFVHANAVKFLVILPYTLVAIIYFWYQDLVDWRIGGVLALGQFTGSWIGSIFLVKSSWANKVSYYALLAVTLISLILLIVRY